MADLLTLPGSIPGLLRRGSPVVVVGLDDETTDREGQRLSLGESAVVTDPPQGADGWCIAAGTTTSGEGPAWSELPARALSLDLTDATGRAHAAWWLGSQPSPPPYTSAAGDGRDACTTLIRARRTWHGEPEPALHVRRPRELGDGMHAAGLADLDPSDPRTLPDGSRWVDAEALRRVALHVAGVTP